MVNWNLPIIGFVFFSLIFFNLRQDVGVKAWQIDCKKVVVYYAVLRRNDLNKECKYDTVVSAKRKYIHRTEQERA